MTSDSADYFGPVQPGLDVVQLVNAQSPITNDDLRRAIRNIETICRGGPSLLTDFLGCIDHAKRDQRSRELAMTHEQIEDIRDLAGLLLRCFDIDPDRATIIAKERIVGTQRTVVMTEIGRYVAIAKDEESRKGPSPDELGRAVAAERHRRASAVRRAAK